MDEKEREQKINDFYNKGLWAMETKQYDYAITLFRSALSLNPDFIKASEGMKLALARKLKSGSDLQQKWRSIILLISGIFQEKLKKWDGAIDRYEKLITLVSPPPPQILAHLGDSYWEKGVTSNAIAAYRSVLNKDQDNVHTLRRLLEFYQAEEQREEVRKICAHLINLAGHDIDIVREVKDAYALLSIEEGQWEEESSFRQKTVEQVQKETEEVPIEKKEDQTKLTSDILSARRNVERYPASREKRERLATLYIENEQWEEAIKEYEKIRDQAPDDMPIRQTLAKLYLKAGSLTKAARAYEDVLKLNPEADEPLQALAELYFKQDNVPRAIEIYKRICTAKPENVNAHLTLADLYNKTRYFDEATEEYEKAITLEPERDDILTLLANLHIRRGNRDKAISTYERLIKLKPDDVESLTSLGELYKEQNMLEQAHETFKKIIQLQPEHYIAQSQLKEIELKLLNTSIDEYGRQLKTTPDNKELLEKLQQAQKEKRRWEIRINEDKLRQDPNNLVIRFELGKLYWEEKDIDKALRELQQAVNDPQRATQVRNLIGLCFESKGMFDLASGQFEKAVSEIVLMTEEKKEILYNLARVYEKMNKKERAVELYKQIYEIDINYRDVSKKLEEAYNK